MHEDQDTLIEQSQQFYWSDCFIRVSRSFLLAMFDAIFLEFSCEACDDSRKMCEFQGIIPKDHPIIP